MPMEKTKLTFNPDMMTVKDIKNAARTLRELLQLYDREMGAVKAAKTDAEEFEAWRAVEERIGSRLLNIRDAFDIELS